MEKNLLVWKDQYSVGIKHLDEQHQKLVEMINELHQSMRRGEGKSLIETILDKMKAYTAIHFKSEEKLFEQYSFPKTSEHKKEHREFVGKVLEFIQKYEKGDAFLSIEIINFLKDWLINHILGSDKEYGPFLNGKGVA